MDSIWIYNIVSKVNYYHAAARQYQMKINGASTAFTRKGNGDGETEVDGSKVSKPTLTRYRVSNSLYLLIRPTRPF